MQMPALVVLTHWCMPSMSYAQLTIQSAGIEGNLVSPSTIFHAVLANVGPAVPVTLEGEVRTVAGEQVVFFRTAPFTVPAGGGMVTAGGTGMDQFMYGSGASGRSARQYHRLPGGEYRYCLKVWSPNSEAGDEYCDELSMESMLFLDLVDPWNGDTIDEERPVLSWMLSGPPSDMANADIRLVLVPKELGSSPSRALATGRPLFMLPHVVERFVPYPVGVPGLERGKCYAWQAERLESGRVVDRSEPWAFCVRRHEPPPVNKYVRLGGQPLGSIYEVIDSRIYFRYDEFYTSGGLDCRIYDEQRKRIEPEVVNDKPEAGDLAARSAGVNVYELDLTSLDLKAGYYYLEVRNGKQQPFTLKFHMAE
jgi:hypothetical protein